MKQMQIHNSADVIADIKQIIEQARKQAYTSINTLMIQSYWLVGRRFVEDEQGGASRAEYGQALLKNLATELMPIYGNSYSARRLQDYRQFYLYFKDIEIWHSRMPNLTWTHYRELLTVGDETARHWYMQEAAKEMWSVRTLHRNISSQYYYRLLQSQTKDVVMDMYIRMYDELKRTEGDNPTIGLILCSRTSEDMARYSMLKDNDRLFQAKYLTFLPTKEELTNEIERQKMIFRLQQENNTPEE